MTGLFFLLLIFIFICIFNKKCKNTYFLFGLFIVLWIAFFIPHTIRYINIQL
jgi:hypothetical protein